MNRGGHGRVAVIRQRLGELAVGLTAAELVRIGIRARGLLRTGVVRDLRAGARRAFYQLREEARRPRTASTLAQHIGVGPEPMTDRRPTRPGRMAGLLPTKLDFGTETGKRERDNAGYTQLEYSRDVAGVRLNKVQRVMKSLAATIYGKIDRWQRLGNAESTEGVFQLSLQNDDPGQRTYLPVYAFDLTSMDQYKGASAYPYPFARLYYDKGFDVFRWNYEQCRNADDTSLIGSWTTEVGPRQTPTAGNTKATYASFIDWVDANFMIYGPRYFPSRVTISVVQFTDEFVCPTAAYDFIPTNAQPGAYVDTLPTSYTGDDKENYNDFWVSFIDRLVRHPLAKKGKTKIGSKMKTLYTKTFEFNPTSTTETDARGHQNMFRLRYNIDKVVRYDEDAAEAGLIPIDNEIQDPDEYPQYDTANDVSTTCNRKGRVYLLISGFAPVDTTTYTPPAGGNVAWAHCSFDLQVRRKSNHVQGITHQQ